MSTPDDIEDTPGLREQMRKIADEATFSDNVGLANEINQRLYADGKLKDPKTSMSLAERMDLLEQMFNEISERLEEKLDAILERIG